MRDIDPVELARALVRRPSVTPADEGALDVVEGALSGLGFECERLKFEDVDNLYACIGAGAPHFLFAGHVDVVPPGDAAAWTHPPFEAAVADGKLWGRGAADMKGAIAAFLAACAGAIDAGAVTGTLSLLITGDEEGPAINGTRRALEILRERGAAFDHCLVGEPSAMTTLGDAIKVGRRGSINCWLTVLGRQGHVAYPARALNPIPALLRKLLALSETTLDEGYERFDPSNLEVTDIHIGNPAHNVIPEKATARFNIRFNPNWTGAAIEAWLRAKLDALAGELGAKYELKAVLSGEAFLTTDSKFVGLVADCVEEICGLRPEYSTAGGTSDARFIKDFAPVVELGLVGATIHQTDEHAALSDIARLRDVYAAMIKRYFKEYGRPS